MPFCSALTNHCCINVRLNFRPCCHFDQEDHNNFSISDYSFEEYKNSKFFKNLKKEIETSWPDGCKKCKTAEDLGLKSLRQNYNEKFSGIDNQLEFLDISLSNVCNLTCKMCNNYYSSRWQAIIDKGVDLDKFNFDKNRQIEKIPSVSNLFKNIDLQHLKSIKYLGGEPFVTKEINEMIEFLKKANIIENVDFRCNTNCTVFPERIFEDLLKFKSIRIDLSVDGIYDLCNFVRTGKDWYQVLFTIEKWLEKYRLYKDKIIINLHHTSNAYNVHQFDLIKNFAKEKNIQFNFYILSTPQHLNYSVLPKNYINEIIESNELTDYKIIKILMNQKEQNLELWNKFVEYTTITDQLLKTDIHSTIPKLAKYIT